MLRHKTEQFPINGMGGTNFEMTEEIMAITKNNSGFFLVERRELRNDTVATIRDAKNNSFINQNGRISNS